MVIFKKIKKKPEFLYKNPGFYTWNLFHGDRFYGAFANAGTTINTVISTYDSSTVFHGNSFGRTCTNTSFTTSALFSINNSRHFSLLARVKIIYHYYRLITVNLSLQYTFANPEIQARLY
jgi:hypothetical protein